MPKPLRAITSLCIEYKHVDGWHVFSSKDLPGLYIASKDAREAFEDVGPALEELFKLNAGISCKAQPELSFDDFISLLSGTRSTVHRPPTFQSQRYAIYQCP